MYCKETVNKNRYYKSSILYFLRHQNRIHWKAMLAKALSML